LQETNSLAYYGNPYITAVIGFMIEDIINLSSALNGWREKVPLAKINKEN